VRVTRGRRPRRHQYGSLIRPGRRIDGAERFGQDDTAKLYRLHHGAEQWRLTLDSEVVYDDAGLRPICVGYGSTKSLHFPISQSAAVSRRQRHVAVVLHLAGFKAATHIRARSNCRLSRSRHRKHALPKQLSGGEAQRVAIARALPTSRELFLPTSRPRRSICSRQNRDGFVAPNRCRSKCSDHCSHARRNDSRPIRPHLSAARRPA